MGIDVEAFEQTYLLAGLGKGDIRQIVDMADLVEFKSGDVLVRCDDTDSDLYVILEGNATVTTIDGKFLGHRTPGSVVGEIALIDDLPRSATVTAEGPLKAARFDSPDLRAFLFQHKRIGFIVLGNLARVLYGRLDEACLLLEAAAPKRQAKPAGGTENRTGQIADSLRQHYRIAGLFDQDLANLAELAQLRELEDGDTIIGAGDSDKDLFVLLEGKFEHMRDGRVLGTFGRNSVIGELALVDTLPRKTSCVARGEVLLARFDGAKLRNFVAQRPDIGYVLVSNLVRVLSARLRDASLPENHADRVGTAETA